MQAKRRPALWSAACGMSACLALGCGDNTEKLPVPCDDQAPGEACTWLGIGGQEGFNGDGHHRNQTLLSTTMDMMFHSNGEVWFHDWNNHLVRRVNSDDTVETVVGWVDPIFPGDGVPGDPAAEKSEDGAPGLRVRLNHPTDFAEDANGDVLLMAWHNHKLRRIDPTTGRVWIDCGAGGGFTGDGGDASLALFKQPNKLVRESDGTLYISDQQNQRVRKIDPDGIITTVAGNGTPGFGGDGGPALEAMVSWEVGSNPTPSGAIAVDGEMLYIADTINQRIRAVNLTSGIIETIAGTGESGYSGDGGPALEATLRGPRDLEIGPDGDLYIADTDNSAIRAIDLSSGEIRTVAGLGEAGLPGEENLPATETALWRPFGIEFDPDGNLFIMDSLNHRIVKVMK